MRLDSKYKIKWRISAAFQIKLHIKDIDVLESIKNTWKIGTITKDSANMVNLNVWSLEELQIIIDPFDKYPLVTTKVSNFLIFKECLEIIKKKEHLTEKGLFKILELKSLLNNGL